ncbi:MAG: acyl carrier protein [Acidobacteria bacterium]|nr:MAG: acyl carrier protein [Acidobacteriota bacterium]
MASTTLTPEAVEARVGAALIEFGADPGAISPAATWEELDIDSLDLVELAQMIEDDYGVELRESDIEQLETVADAVAAVIERVG